MGLTLLVLILLTSFPAGYLLAHLCRDELVPGRKWFKLISVVSLLTALIMLFVYKNFPVILTLIYICIISLISLYLSYNKKFLIK
ncbi:hypothetical protein FJZ19_03425 [Candidatus Pacearchaeota archaeon]|nr:hypothetical protein [Candidatus Pacearchaeota archaeon]